MMVCTIGSYFQAVAFGGLAVIALWFTFCIVRKLKPKR